MSRISQDLAKQIAYKLTEKTKVMVEKVHTDYKELATGLYEKQTPDEVKECFKHHPDYFTQTSRVDFSGHGFNYEQVKTTRNLLKNSYSQANLRLDAKIADKISRLKTKYEKAKKDYEALKEETEQALLALRTFNNIRKELPEAAQFLPPPISNALVCNFESLKTKLHKQISLPTLTA